MNRSGVYQIINTINNKCYIGSAIVLKKRKREHWSALNRGEHANRYLQNAWNKYGGGGFEFRVIGFCRPEDLLRMEQHLLNDVKPKYNICPIAGSALGKEVSESTRRKIRQAKKGKRPAEETGHKMSEAKKGKKRSKGVRCRISEAQKGRKRSEETKRKIGEAKKGNQYNLGKKLSEDTKRKMSEAQKGKHHNKPSEETKRKISEALKARAQAQRRISLLGE